MRTPAEFVESEQTKAREFFVEVEHPVVGRYGQVRPMHLFSESPGRVRSAAPLVGQHNEEVFVGELGLSRGELISLKAAGVI
jgi:crotonobetainyl-CoA:carnitine CoA-transferase CaiB-like acyl-CoA transferase